ncbi:MAG TPA: TonB-dependent receptor [Sphingomicrobium sp.]|nr:TonB-dependent receptor [Sphingomicrobium sp.]
MPVLPIEPSQIVITASRSPEPEAQSPASVSIIDRDRIDRLGEPLVLGLLRLTPSTSVTSIGPSGSLTEVRIRGSEANHTLFFVDGIKINDPASGDAPRFELLNADLASRIEVLRGPQSALWGSDAIGGVIAVNGLDDQPGYAAGAEAGSFGFRRASASGAAVAGPLSLTGALGWQRATGIDSFGAPGGDKDGYRNLSGRARATYALTPSIRLGGSALALTGKSEFDGYRVVFPFDHNDTLDSSRNRLLAGRIWAELGTGQSAWSGRVAASLLGSSNRNYLSTDPINRTSGKRRIVDAQVERRFTTGTVDHRIIVAAEAEHETFRATDTIYGGFTNQNRDRDHQAVTAEWRASAKAVHADVALRRDIFNRFRDATSLRASLLGHVGGGFQLTASYAEGIAQPTFFDLYGFFPGNFVGNPALKAESSRGWEASARYRRGAFAASLTGYRQRLYDEILDVGDPVTFLRTTINLDQVSHRSGVEAEAGWRLDDKLRLTANYAYLHATERDIASGLPVTEHRRPRHSGAIAVDGTAGRWSYGGSVAYVGSQLDTRDNFPFDVVRLRSYWLAGARVAYAVRPGIELYARGSNLFDARYENSVGYRTEGVGLFAGIRLAGR